ncbi:unnamed protein product (macronuclear) [Paramecium tetraurelia]|uniref:Transmembrane protein n=1 Tax=Paramecium tetraurelia TaxID=5888 RepID=A0BUN7_PARTE|nr:uncharacterized protein GSPATT00005500001 [Paramecium tetraurelia]CAK62254.1 unnamed protein product [Paramecium tetraurelia]|eukprot:XP_001429652.1 hypothetical protein (macronuclear) [Paramecium tetraurelia strain d4-2]
MFKYKKLEDEYQKSRINTISIPVFQFGSACIFIVATSKLITLVLQNELGLMPILIGCQIYSLLSFLFLRFNIHKINIQLIILAYLLIGYELIITTDTSPQALSLYQSNFTMCGVIIILISEFKESLVIILSTFSFKIIYTILMETQKSYIIYCTTLILMFFMCFFSYKLNVLNRTSFLLSQYDYMWESVFPKIVDTPYLIFTFSEEKLEFIFKSQNKLPFQCNNSKQLKEFLREWHWNQLSIENVLFNLYNNQSLNEFHSRKIEIQKDNKTKQSIRYSMMKSLSSTFIIKFDDSIIKVDDCKVVLKGTIKKQEELRMQLVKRIYKNLQMSLISKQQNNLWLIRNNCLKQIMDFKIMKYQWKTKLFDTKKLLFLNDIFVYKLNRLQIINPKNQNITTIVVQLKRLIFEVLELTKNQSSVDVTISETVTISYEGREMKYDKDAALKLIWYNLVEKSEMQENLWVIQLHKEPCVNFTNQK